MTELSHTYIHLQDGCKRSTVQFRVLTISCKLQEVSNMVQVVQKIVQDVSNRVTPYCLATPPPSNWQPWPTSEAKLAKKLISGQA